AGLGGGLEGATRVGVGALQGRLEGGGVEGDDFVHVAGGGDGFGVAGGQGHGLTGGFDAELGELLDVGERQLGEVGELLDRRFVRGGELVDLDHCGGPLGSWVEAALCCTAQTVF